MRINITQLMQRKELAKAYIISSDEILLRTEAIQHIKKIALTHGFQLCKTWQTDQYFDWQTFLNATTQQDLFGDNTIHELRLHSLKIGTEGSSAISEFLNQQNEQQILIINCDKLDSNALKSKWLTALDKQGCILQLWAPDSKALPQWIDNRLQQQCIKVSNTALQLIADHSEGNLMATQQNIERLILQYGSKTLSDEEVTAALYNSSRYTIFDLVDVWLSGNKIRISKVFNCLISEGTEAILILWALTRECRLLAILQQELKTDNFATLANKHRIWQKRMPLVKQHLEKKYDYLKLLQQLAQIELIVKGTKKANVWDELQRFLIL